MHFNSVVKSDLHDEDIYPVDGPNYDNYYYEKSSHRAYRNSSRNYQSLDQQSINSFCEVAEQSNPYYVAGYFTGLLSGNIGSYIFDNDEDITLCTDTIGKDDLANDTSVYIGNQYIADILSDEILLSVKMGMSNLCDHIENKGEADALKIYGNLYNWFIIQPDYIFIQQGPDNDIELEKLQRYIDLLREHIGADGIENIFFQIEQIPFKNLFADFCNWNTRSSSENNLCSDSSIISQIFCESDHFCNFYNNVHGICENCPSPGETCWKSNPLPTGYQRCCSECGAVDDGFGNCTISSTTNSSTTMPTTSVTNEFTTEPISTSTEASTIISTTTISTTSLLFLSTETTSGWLKSIFRTVTKKFS